MFSSFTDDRLNSRISNYMTSRVIAIFRVITISIIRSSSLKSMFIYEFKMKYITTNMCIVLITNNRQFLVFKTSRNSRNNIFILKFAGQDFEFDSFVDKLNFDKMII